MKVEQISIFIENKTGRLAEVSGVLGDAGINIRPVDDRAVGITFDETSTLTRKQYGGPVVRPPDQTQNNFKIGG